MRTPADRGASAVEFGLLVAALAVGIVGAVSVAGAGVQNVLAAAITAITG
jgi:Flp pilus assembly pilin Flp